MIPKFRAIHKETGVVFAVNQLNWNEDGTQITHVLVHTPKDACPTCNHLEKLYDWWDGADFTLELIE